VFKVESGRVALECAMCQAINEWTFGQRARGAEARALSQPAAIGAQHAMNQHTVTHFISFDALGGRGRTALALCGQYVGRSTHASEPTCALCAHARARELADTRTGEEVFGRAGE